MDSVFEALQRIEPLKRRRNPSWAAVWGFLLGGIGLALYLRSVIDFFIPIVAAVALIYFVGDFGWFIGACVAAVYGYFRVTTSNEMLAQQDGQATPGHEPQAPPA
jgi:hypothetical protein